VSAEFIDALTRRCRSPEVGTFGLYSCTFCSPEGAEYDFTDTHEIRVRARDGRTYCAPTKILHYVRVHGYRPPDEFIEAVLDEADPVEIVLSRKTVTLPWWSRLVLLIESGDKTIEDEFNEAARTSRPVRLTLTQKSHLLEEIDHWAAEMPRGHRALPDGIAELRAELFDEVVSELLRRGGQGDP